MFRRRYPTRMVGGDRQNRNHRSRGRCAPPAACRDEGSALCPSRRGRKISSGSASRPGLLGVDANVTCILGRPRLTRPPGRGQSPPSLSRPPEMCGDGTRGIRKTKPAGTAPGAYGCDPDFYVCPCCTVLTLRLAGGFRSILTSADRSDEPIGNGPENAAAKKVGSHPSTIYGCTPDFWFDLNPFSIPARTRCWRSITAAGICGGSSSRYGSPSGSPQPDKNLACTYDLPLAVRGSVSYRQLWVVVAFRDLLLWSAGRWGAAGRHFIGFIRYPTVGHVRSSRRAKATELAGALRTAVLSPLARLTLIMACPDRIAAGTHEHDE